MNIKEIIKYCLSKQGTFEDYPFGPAPTVIKVGSKMFAIISEKDGQANISLKCEPFLAQNLRQQYKSITPGYHLNKEHWNTVIVDNSIPISEIKWMINHSYELVVMKLSKSEKEKLKSS